MHAGVLVDGTKDQIFTYRNYDFYKNGVKFVFFEDLEVASESIIQ